MQGWARQNDQNEVISTLPMAPQQLTIMPMIQSHVEIDFCLRWTREEGDLSYPAGLNKYQTHAEHEEVVYSDKNSLLVR